MLETNSLLPQGSAFKADILLGTVMSVTLVVIGVAASKMEEPLYLGLLILFTLFLITLQYLSWLRSRPAVFHKELQQHFCDRSNLLSAMAEIASHSKNLKGFTRNDLELAIHWWWEEDLYLDYHWDLKIEEDEKKRRREQSPGVSGWLRHLWSIRRRLVTSERMHLLEIVYSVPNQDVASLIIARGLEEGFIKERLIPGEHISKSRIEYVWTNKVLIQPSNV